MITKFNTIKKSRFIKNVLMVMSGTALAQIITFSLMPIITRLYGPESIGVLGTFTAVVAILGPIAALTYPIAIVLPKSDRKSRSIVKFSLLLTLVVGLIITVILLLAAEKVVNLFRLDVISSFIYLLPLFVLVTGLSQVMEQWLIRTKSFKVTAKTAVLQSIFMNGLKVGGGLVYPLSATLVIIQTAGVLFRASLMFFMSDKSIVNRSEKHTIEDLKEVARENQDFPKYRAPQVFINAVSQGLPVLLFASFFGPAVAGFYALGKQALNTPSQLIGKAVQNVFYPKVNELANTKRRITPIIIKAVSGLLIIGIVPFGVIILFGPMIFSFVFGNEWIIAGEYARWIAIVALSMLITRPIIVAIPVLSIQRQFLLVEIVGTAVKTGAILTGVFFFNEAIFAVALFSIASVLMYLYLIILTLFVSRRFDQFNKSSGTLDIG
ncbi:O-antigen flippase Wzx [Halalkalibacter wakoensis JCM 9140]|uniref:O-antigen flippase Wzx n=1 Tax=Halalkalibacter wakoensis JCM 9140 TaxID=1236970 RepID=W4QAV9_9BACI|nr:oligosaccharide flippase family protein [Halalkalibacter wakoensis]GAE28504.1 O-antigen flippase Wzx [Halalkalibacter wakoensis JCM 9140]